MNRVKEGFTLVELLAVIVILGLILAIAIPRITELIENSKLTAAIMNEKILEDTARKYLGMNDLNMPTEIGEIIEVTLGELQAEGLMQTINNPYGSDNCDGHVLIVMVDENELNYYPHLQCGEDYETPLNAHVLVVGGGGGGATTVSDTGGGGAGGLIFIPSYSLESGESISVTVGNGGTPNNDGEDSEFGDLIALGGGGGSTTQNDGRPGGSGGGAGRNSGVGGETLQPNQSGDSGKYGFGNRGGTNTGHGGTEGMGGGGAGYPGVDAIGITANIKHGGDGLFQVTADDGPYDKVYNFASVFGTNYGEIIDGQAWFAGGGGGGGERGNYTQNLGGKGGGGRGGHLNAEVSRTGYPGMSNTGGGGGGSDNTTGGTGGSGIVLVRYPGHQRANGGTITTINGYTIHAFTEVGEHTFEVLPY